MANYHSLSLWEEQNAFNSPNIIPDLTESRAPPRDEPTASRRHSKDLIPLVLDNFLFQSQSQNGFEDCSVVFTWTQRRRSAL